MKKYAEIIHYEIGMLQYCFDEINNSLSDRVEYRNLILEGFLLHARNLIEFYNRNNNQEILYTEYNDISKHLAHPMTPERQNKNKKIGWDYNHIYQVIVNSYQVTDDVKSN